MTAGLQSKDPTIRARAARQLGERRDVDAVDALIRCLRDRADGVQIAAAEALGRTGDARAVPPLICSLKGETYRLTDGEGNPGQYFEIISSAAWALGQIGDPRALWALLEQSDAKDGLAAAAALVGLGQIQNEQAFAALLRALRHPYHYVRLHAARMLGQYGDARAVDLLIEALRDKVWTVQVAAAEALGSLRHAGCAEPLRAIFEEVDSFLSRSRIDQHLLADVRIHLLSQAARGLALIDDPSSLQVLADGLKSEDWQARAAASIGLAYRGDSRVFDTLVQAVHERSIAALRIEAMNALACLANPAAIPLLVAVAAERDAPIRVCEAAKRAMARMNGEEQVMGDAP